MCRVVETNAFLLKFLLRCGTGREVGKKWVKNREKEPGGDTF